MKLLKDCKTASADSKWLPEIIMNKTLSRLKLWQKIVLIICTFTLPLGVLGVFVFQGYQKDIKLAQWEKWGNEYQRPLEQLLELLPQHQSLVARDLAGGKGLKTDLANKAAQIDKAFETLETVDAKLGVALQFTPEGLAKRKREHVQVHRVKDEWQNLKVQTDKLSPQASQEQHAHLVSDIRIMITHAGDNSNLILDPDLDSYYLMDVTLVALPQTQDRLATVTSYGEELLKKKLSTKAELTQLAVHAALLKEADLDRVTSNAQTALNEDDNFYGRSESLQRNMAPALSEYEAATSAFIELIQKVADSEKMDCDPAVYVAAGNRAREVSFKLWQVAVNELDVLLQNRIAHFEGLRNRVFTLTSLALLVSTVLAFFITRSITHLIGKLTASSAAIAATAKQQQATTNEVAATTVEIGATSKEISSTSKELVKTMNEVAQVAEQTTQLAGSGQSGLARMESTMRQIMDASAVISSKLTVVNEKAGNISNVVTTINKVADQTNLLSLNAAIEAEKAGEYGLGFAVVANEIRRLADQTAVATFDIEQMVKEMLSAVAAGVMGMDKFAEEVRKGATDVQQVAAQLAQIIQQVQTLTPRFESVNEGMQSQATGAQQISEALGQLSEAAQQTAQSLRESNQAIGQLTQAAHGLKDGVGHLEIAA